MRFSSCLAITFIALSAPAFAQKKADRAAARQLQTDISYLASDELTGRRTSTQGEKLAADYIEQRYKDLDIKPFKGQYRYPFHFVYGREVAPTTQIRIGNKVLRLNEEAFPLPYSASKHITSEVLPDVTEQGSVWLVPLYTDKDQANDPHFDWEKHMHDYAREAKTGGASGVVFYDPYKSDYAPVFDSHSEHDPLEIPVVFINFRAYEDHVKARAAEQKSGIPIDLNITINKTERTGTNIAAYIDNGAKYTVVVGAHYDHLGYGEDGNSLLNNAIKEHQIHHGADDNASGTAALMEVAKWVKKKKLHNFNYLFVHFSGEELGLFGSKAFVRDQKIDSSQTAYMINMDMVGRLNDSTNALDLGGVGTSPVWEEVVTMGSGNFKLVLDSAGAGPSDHTSFYNAGIPVLFFFTGTHKDYHKPSDKADLINYPGEVKVIRYAESVLTKMDNDNIKPAYTVTKQKTMGKGNFKVTLGIMPDYSYQEGGVRVDGVSDNRPAIKAGIKTGDIIIQLGNIKILSMDSYMESLRAFKPGDKTIVKIKRDGKEMELPIELNK